MRKLILGFVGAAALTGSTAAYAQEELFAKLDANKDGFVTLDEVEGESKSKLERLLRTGDKNADQKLSLEEFAAALQPRETPRTPVESEGRRGAGQGERPNFKFLFERTDANKDGKLSKEEAPERLKENFERLDTNRDGFVDLAEFERMAGRDGGDRRPPDANLAGELFDRQDANRDGKLTKDEIPEGRRENFQRMLDRVDTDGDGAVTKGEFVRVMLAMAQAGRPGGAPERRPDGRPGDGRPGEGRPGEGRPGMMSPVVRALDADGDGEISAAEIKEAAAALAKLDKNSDGKLTRDEVLPPFPPMRPGEPRPEGRPDRRPGEGRPGAGFRPNPEDFVRRLKEADANGDGKISEGEAPGFVKENFARFDGNSDGSIDETEIKQIAERMMRGGPRGPGREGDRRPEGRRPEGRRPGGERPEQERPEGEKPAEPK